VEKCLCDGFCAEENPCKFRTAITNIRDGQMEEDLEKNRASRKAQKKLLRGAEALFTIAFCRASYGDATLWSGICAAAVCLSHGLVCRASGNRCYPFNGIKFVHTMVKQNLRTITDIREARSVIFVYCDAPKACFPNGTMLRMS
jgi:hypothetical protein